MHRLVYGSAVAGVIHYYWLVKSDIRQPRLYAILFGILLGYRAVVWIMARRTVAPVRANEARELA
jgi:sulfoxide reductase heme-binding subunit YedZ